jgi:hypothetical protein
LRVKIDVRYPSRLTSEQKFELRRVLGGVSWWLLALAVELEYINTSNYCSYCWMNI